MFRAAALHVRLDKRNNGFFDLVIKLADQLSANYSTFKDWTSGAVGPRMGRTLAELLIGNYATLREWGAMTRPGVRRED